MITLQLTPDEAAELTTVLDREINLIGHTSTERANLKAIMEKLFLAVLHQDAS